MERNLRAPLQGIGADVSVGLRTGDTPQKERQAMKRTPPDILITTPESLYLMMTSQVREILTGVEAVIVDEIHAVAPTKRGAHLVLTLERLSELAGPRAIPSRSGSGSRQLSVRSSASPSSSSARSASARSSTPGSARRWTSRSSSRSTT